MGNKKSNKVDPAFPFDWRNVKLENDYLNQSLNLLSLDLGRTDLMESTVLFRKNEPGRGKKYFKSQILRRNWHEVCEVYDDFDVHDVNFSMKAVGLKPNSYFSSCSQGFEIGADIDVFFLTIDGKHQKINYSASCLTMNTNLRNEQEIKVHMKYRKFKKKDGQRFWIKEYYGLFSSLANQKAKFILRVRNSLEIIDIENDAFVKGENPKEYIWGGTVPQNGYRHLVRFSLPFADWKIESLYGVKTGTSEPIRGTTLFLPLSFVSGNLQIVSLANECPQASGVSIKNGQYEITLKDTGSSLVTFKTSGTVRNRARGEWRVNLSEEEVSKKVESCVGNEKKQLKEIAEEIIKNDKSTKPDFVKICRWVKKNISYDIALSGRTDMTPMQIYNTRRGVCHHFTILFNGLMISLGFPSLYVSGFASEKSTRINEEDGHCWSLVKIEGKWIPFDATWGIWSGRLPVCHLISGFSNDAGRFSTTDLGLSFIPHKISAKFIGI